MSSYKTIVIMKRLYYLFIIASLEMMFCSFNIISDEEMINMGVTEEELLQLKEDVVHGQEGKIEFPDCHANINVPSDFVYLDEKQSKKLLVEYCGNPESRISGLLGVLVPSDASCFYQISVAYVISYEESGYIRDDDAYNIDYNELLQQMKEGAEEENKSLPETQRCTIKGWAVPPKYISPDHVLIWAKLLEFSTGDIINYDIRILGKEGFVSINAVIDPELIKEVESQEVDIIKSFSFDNGYEYNSFNPSTDKISDWTIGGLVAGGILAKSGILAKIGIFLVKFWKLIAIGIVGVGAAVTKFFRRKRNENEDENDYQIIE